MGSIGPTYANSDKYVDKVLSILDEAETLLSQGELEAHHPGTNEPVKKPKIKQFIRSPHYGSRTGADINTIILHYTTAGNVQSTINWFKGNPDKVSAHYIVDKNGDIYQMVADREKAHHAGNANRSSIGIEHVAKDKDRFTKAQEKSSIALVRWLMGEYKIPAANILAHKGTSGSATRCPGNLFGDDGDDHSSTKLKMFDAWVARHFERSMVPAAGTDTINEDTHTIYITKPGDTLFRLAMLHGMSVDELKELNPDIVGVWMFSPPTRTRPN